MVLADGRWTATAEATLICPDSESFELLITEFTNVKWSLSMRLYRAYVTEGRMLQDVHVY